MLKKILFIHIIFLLPRILVLSQDSTKYLIGYDLIKGIINEQSITFGYSLTQRHSITLSLGFTHDNEPLRLDFQGFSPSQDKYPFLVYKGPTFRTSYRFFLVPFFYVSADFFYKYLYYSNHTFEDSNTKDEYWTYTRNEKSNVIGFHINTGFIITIPITHLFINPAIGVGRTQKFRKYTTTYSETVSRVPLGTFSKKISYVSLLMSLNIGIRF